MKTTKILVSGLFIFFLMSAFTTCSSTQTADTKIITNPLLIYAKGKVYNKEWTKVDSLVHNGLTKSALAAVQKINKKAKAENNYQQIVKTLMVTAKLQTYLKDDAFINTIQALTSEATKSSYPLKPFLHSMIAELYWQYYQSNRWKFRNRTTTVNFKNEDIATWDLKHIIEITTQHYLLSIKNIDSLKRTPISAFDELIIKKDSQNVRPFLYDFLAHRALDFFMNEEPSLTKPVYEFVLDNKAYLADNKTFVKLNIASKDTTSLKYYALKILQNLTKTHLNDTNTTNLVDVALKRLKFVKNNAVFQGADSLYYNAITLLYANCKNLPISTEVAYEMANFLYVKGNKYKPLKSEKKQYKWELKKARNICLKAKKSFPKSLGAQNCDFLIHQITQKSLNVSTAKVNVPNQPFLAKISAKNINQVFFRLYKINPEAYKKWHLENKEKLTKILSQQPIKSWRLTLKTDGDFQNHTGLFKINQQNLGFYILLTSSDSAFAYTKGLITTTPFWVSNLSYLSRKLNNGGDQFFVMDRTTGNPIAGVKAKLYIDKYNYTSRRYTWKLFTTKTTDKNGSFILLPSNNYRNYYVDFSFKNDKLNTLDRNYQYQKYTPKHTTSIKTIFFTDRAIYRPGQTVYFKGIVITTDNQNNNKIKTNFKSIVSFYDVNTQKIKSLHLITNEYGTFSGSFVTPNNGLNGQMHIKNGYGTKYFSVEEYKRPKFEVKFNPIKGSYKLAETVHVVGTAKAYSGAALDDATVNYRVVRNASFPYWCFYRWGYSPQSASMEIKNGTTTTDDNGKFKIDFVAKSDKSVKKEFSPTYSYTIYADVVDVNGETHSANTSVYVGYKALNINIKLPENVNKRGIDTFNLTTTNLNGELEPAKGNVKIWALKMPNQFYRKSIIGKGDKKYITKEDFVKNFPHDVFDDENNHFKWKKNIKVYDHDFNTANKKSFQFYHLPECSTGYYVLEATTTDKFGQKVKTIKYFTVFDDNAKHIPINKIGWFAELKKQGEPGEKAIFLIGSAAKNVTILYEIEHKNKIISSERLILKSGEQRKIVIPIKEEFRGNFQVHFTFVKLSRKFTYTSTVVVPYTNKQLDLQFETFRNKLLPGQKETWKIKIQGKKGEKVAAEMVATLYDASLDAFKPNYWGLDILKYDYSNIYWANNTSFSPASSSLVSTYRYNHFYFKKRVYNYLNWFGFHYQNYYGYYSRGNDGTVLYDMESAGERVLEEDAIGNSRPRKKKFRTISAPSFAESAKDKNGETTTKDEIVKIPGVSANSVSQIGTGGVAATGKDFSAIKARKNFNETAFFYPHLTTNEKGEIIINFTIPEALTKWKFMGFAHTKDLKTGMIYEETVTQKDLMVYPNAPRFFRENDKMTFSTKIINLSGKDLEGSAKIFFYDALTSQLISEKLLVGKETIPFNVKKGKSTSVNWQITIPEGYSAITYKVIAKAGNFTDGEEMAIPVLTNRMLVTEAMPLPVRGHQTKHFKFEKLINNKSTTLRNYRLTLEFTSNPAWYAIQALPYLMEYPYECAEQTFSRFYANSIAAHIANSNPKIKAVFESWKQKSSKTFLSNLEKNQELKSVILEETPWVLNAKNESERKKRIGLLFDLNKMSNELGKAEKKLQQLQVANGGWTWFKGMPESRYITQYIVTGMGHLDHLGIKNIRSNYKTWNMVKKAVRYLDDRIREDYERLKKYDVNLEKDHISYTQIQYLYARSYFTDLKIDSRNQEAYNYYKGQAKKYWLNKSRYMQGMIALALHREDKAKTGISVEQKIMASLKENAINSDEMGMYWKDIRGGYYWYQAPIETQALLIEAFDEVANDKKSVEAMKVWLLKQKQTQDWRTTKATAEACYALLLRGTDLLASNELVEIKVGDKIIDPKKMDDVKVEAGTGYFKTSWSKSEIKPNMGNVTVTKKDDGVAWGAMYWQYFEDLDKITSAETPLKLVKKLFLQKSTPTGLVITPIMAGTKLKVGDKIKVRIELRVDRDMEYVHMKDMRAAGLEPINVFSGYRYQGGLGYYESTKDASTNFFFDYLKKGTYVFEYPLRVNMNGDFSNGISSIQCMYAPEFTAHSEGIRIKVGN